MVRLWKQVAAEEIINYLEKMEFPDDVTFGSPEKWVKYIQHEFNAGKFDSFKVFLMSNQLKGNADIIGGYVSNRPERKIYPHKGLIDIGVLRSGNDLDEISVYIEEDLDSIKEPILLIYPIVVTEEKQPSKNINQNIIGLSIVFPDSDTEDVEYTINTVAVEELNK